MPQHHHEPPASALARGNTKTSDIESCRRDLRRAERSAARELQAKATRHVREITRQEREVRDRRGAEAPPASSPAG